MTIAAILSSSVRALVQDLSEQMTPCRLSGERSICRFSAPPGRMRSPRSHLLLVEIVLRARILLEDLCIDPMVECPKFAEYRRCLSWFGVCERSLMVAPIVVC